MIVIKAEIWPHGLKKKKYVIGELDITNDGTGSLKVGNYILEFVKKSFNRTLISHVEDSPRQEKDVWKLLYLGLKKYYEKEKKTK